MRLNYVISAGSVLPAPVSYSVTKDTLAGEADVYSEAGRKHRDIIRNDIYTVQCEWKLTASQNAHVAEVLSASDVLDITFYDLTSAKFVTQEMYVESKSASVSIPGKDDEEMFTSFSCTLKSI